MQAILFEERRDTSAFWIALIAVSAVGSSNLIARFGLETRGRDLREIDATGAAV